MTGQRIPYQVNILQQRAAWRVRGVSETPLNPLIYNLISSKRDIALKDNLRKNLIKTS